MRVNIYKFYNRPVHSYLLYAELIPSAGEDADILVVKDEFLKPCEESSSSSSSSEASATDDEPTASALPSEIVWDMMNADNLTVEEGKVVAVEADTPGNALTATRPIDAPALLDGGGVHFQQDREKFNFPEPICNADFTIFSAVTVLDGGAYLGSANGDNRVQLLVGSIFFSDGATRNLNWFPNKTPYGTFYVFGVTRAGSTMQAFALLEDGSRFPSYVVDLPTALDFTKLNARQSWDGQDVKTYLFEHRNYSMSEEDIQTRLSEIMALVIPANPVGTVVYIRCYGPPGYPPQILVSDTLTSDFIKVIVDDFVDAACYTRSDEVFDDMAEVPNVTILDAYDSCDVCMRNILGGENPSEEDIVIPELPTTSDLDIDPNRVLQSVASLSDMMALPTTSPADEELYRTSSVAMLFRSEAMMDRTMEALVDDIIANLEVQGLEVPDIEVYEAVDTTIDPPSNEDDDYLFML